MKKSHSGDEDFECKILITCTKPSKDGKMSVEMSYDGDPTLASYILERAQSCIQYDEDLEAQL